jgi:hypothetical protein
MPTVSPTPAPAPQSSAKPSQGWLAWLGLIVIILVVIGCLSGLAMIDGWLSDLGGAGFRLGSSAPLTESRKLPTKAEWLAKLESHYGQPAHLRILGNWRSNEFKQFMGVPDSTQTFGDCVFRRISDSIPS